MEERDHLSYPDKLRMSWFFTLRFSILGGLCSLLLDAYRLGSGRSAAMFVWLPIWLLVITPGFINSFVRREWPRNRIQIESEADLAGDERDRLNYWQSLSVAWLVNWRFLAVSWTLLVFLISVIRYANMPKIIIPLIFAALIQLAIYPWLVQSLFRKKFKGFRLKLGPSLNTPAMTGNEQ